MLIINENGTAEIRVPHDQAYQLSQISGGDVVVELSQYQVSTLFEIVMGHATNYALDRIAQRNQPEES